MRGVWVLVLSAVVVGAAGCGGGGVSKAAYRNGLAKIAKESDAAHGALEQGAAKAKSVAQVQKLLQTFATAEDRLGDEVAKLKAPSDATAANAELARGEHDDAAEIRAVVPKLSKFKTVQQVFGYLQNLGHTTGGREEDDALAKLKKLGYTKGS
jgi:hypothetical protein